MTKAGPAVEAVAPDYKVIGFTDERASHAEDVVRLRCVERWQGRGSEQ